MTEPSQLEITQLLKAWGSGDEQAFDKLTPLVYDQLRRVARRYMADNAQVTFFKPQLSSMRPMCACLIAGSSIGRIARTSSPFVPD
jgi:hypothetical protein